MSGTMSSINAMIQSGEYKVLLDALKAFRNGFVYGVKVRAPHALIMSLLWSRGPPLQMATKIFNAAKQHGLNLGLTACAYKLVTALLRRLVVSGMQDASPAWVSFVGGLVAGGLFWGEQNPINSQVSMYLLSRVLSGLLWSLIGRYQVQLPPSAFRAFAALMWGLVMVLYMHQPSTLQGSLQSSMHYIYKDSEKYSGLYDLIVVNSS